MFHIENTFRAEVHTNGNWFVNFTLSFIVRIHVEFLSLHDNTKFNRYCVHDTCQLDYENVHCLPVNNTR